MTTPVENVAEYLAPCIPVTDEVLEQLGETAPPTDRAHEKLVFAMARQLRVYRQENGACGVLKALPGEVAPVAVTEPEPEAPEKAAKSKGAK